MRCVDSATQKVFQHGMSPHILSRVIAASAMADRPGLLPNLNCDPCITTYKNFSLSLPSALDNDYGSTACR